MPHFVNSARQTGGVIPILLLWAVGIALIFYVCVMRDLPRVQSKLYAKVLSSVVGAGAANANVTLDGRDVILNGSASSVEQREAAAYAARKVFGVRQVVSKLQIEAPLEAITDLQPPELSIQVANATIKLYGRISSEDSASLIAEGVQQSYPTHTVQNKIEVMADTAEPGWLETTLSSLKVLRKVQYPEIDITEDQIMILGTVDSAETRDAVFQELELIYGDELNIINAVDVVEPTPLIDPELSLVLNDNKLTLSGRIRSSEDLEKVASAAMGAFDLKLINNELSVNTEVAQALWLAPTLELLPQLGAFDTLKLAINPDLASIAGTVDSTEQRDAALKLFSETIGSILPFEENITVNKSGGIDSSDIRTSDIQTGPKLAENNKSRTNESGNESGTGTNSTTTIDATGSGTGTNPDATESGTGTNSTATVDATESGTGTSSVATADATESGTGTNSTATADAIESGTGTNSAAIADAAESTIETGDSTTTDAETSTATTNVKPAASSREQALAVQREGLEKALAELALENIRFEVNSTTLTDQSKKILASVALVLEKFSAVGVTVTGHTDTVGTVENNLVLSRERAESVRDFLLAQGIPTFRLDALGLGESSPIASNNSPEGRALNRRIEFNY